MQLKLPKNNTFCDVCNNFASRTEELPAGLAAVLPRPLTQIHRRSDIRARGVRPSFVQNPLNLVLNSSQDPGASKDTKRVRLNYGEMCVQDFIFAAVCGSLGFLTFY